MYYYFPFIITIIMKKKQALVIEWLPDEWMALLLFCITIMRAPTIPSPVSRAGGGVSGLVVTWAKDITVYSLYRVLCFNHNIINNEKLTL